MTFLSLCSFLFILLGSIEAIWGLGQLYGVVLSHHSQYLLTGSFYNPGPYSGFLAMIFPIACYSLGHSISLMTIDEQRGRVIAMDVMQDSIFYVYDLPEKIRKLMSVSK